MSTKIQLASGDKFHLYFEVFDTERIYLRLDKVPFEATPASIVVPIPVDIWETIRQIAVVKLDLADASDEQIRLLVEKDVDERIIVYQETNKGRKTSLKKSFLNQSVGETIYGPQSAPREKQIISGIKFYKCERKRVRRIRNRMICHQVNELLIEAQGKLKREFESLMLNKLKDFDKN